MGPNLTQQCPAEGKFEHRDRYTQERAQWEDEGKIGVMHPHAEKGQWLFTNHQELGRALKQNQPIEGTKPADTLSQTSGFQNCETINLFRGTLLQLP